MVRHEQGFPPHFLLHKDSSPVPQKKASQSTLDMHPSHMKELSQGIWQRDKQTQGWGSRLYSRFHSLQHSLESALPCGHFYYGLGEDFWLCICRGHTVVTTSMETMPLQWLESHQRHWLQGRGLGEQSTDQAGRHSRLVARHVPHDNHLAFIRIRRAIMIMGMCIDTLYELKKMKSDLFDRKYIKCAWFDNDP